MSDERGVMSDVLAAALFVCLFKKGLEDGFKLGENFPVDAVTGFCAVNGSSDQTSVEEFFEVLRDGALRQRQHFHDFTTDTGFSLRQHF